MKRVVAGIIVQEGKLLVCQRTRHQTMPLKWEFPGGKIEEGEQPRDALRRELEEELGITAKIGNEIARIRHEYPNGGMVELRFFEVREFQKGNREQDIQRYSMGRTERTTEVRLPGSGSNPRQRPCGWKTALALPSTSLATYRCHHQRQR